MDGEMKRALKVTAVVVIAAVVVAGCTSGDSRPPISVDSAVADLLKRPLAGPEVAPGAACPVTRVVTRPTSLVGDLLGDGPVRPVMSSTLRYDGEDRGTLFEDSGWGGRKVLWVAGPDLAGPVVIRGRRLDGDDPVGFDGTEGQPLDSKIVMLPDPSAEGWRDRPGYVRLRAPGCYAFQVDTVRGSSVIVFRAVGPAVT